MNEASTAEGFAAKCQMVAATSLYDLLVGAGEQRRRHVEAERLG
jgi:hypothetical protein